MRITIKYFGQIAEATQKTEETIDMPDTTISELLTFLKSKYSALKDKNFQIAQNQEITPITAQLTGAEIALLPPFSGG